MNDSTRLPGRDVLIALNRAATTARLLSGVVHEVNNALQVISGTVELLETRPDLPETIRPALERVLQQSARAAGVLSEVQLFTRAPLGETTRVDLREMGEHSLLLRAFAIRRAGLTGRLQSSHSGRFVVMGNRGQLQQAVLNLIVNAEEALAAVHSEIVLDLNAEDGWLTLLVSDGGPGIAIEPIERAFEPFVSTRDPWDGAGLGLWAARVIVAEHGGSVTIDERAAGTAVAIRLPGVLEG